MFRNFFMIEEPATLAAGVCRLMCAYCGSPPGKVDCRLCLFR
jgi:hypothetical protein